MNHKVYISYSIKDAEIAIDICEAIESNDIKCWIAARDLDSQKDPIEQRVNAIESAENVVLIYSKNAMESAHVNNEIYHAVYKKIDVIVVNVDGSSEGSDLYIGENKPKATFRGISDEFKREIPFESYGENKPKATFRGPEKFKLEIPSLNVNETITKRSNSQYIYLSYDDADLMFISSQIKQFKSIGVNFKHQIDSKIKDSSLLVVFISKNSFNSSKIKDDITKAISNDVGILMIYLDNVEPDFGRLFNFKYDSKFKNAIKYSIFKQELDELSYMDKCDEIFQIFGVNK